MSLAASRSHFCGRTLARHMYPESISAMNWPCSRYARTAGPMPQFIEIQSNSSSLRAASLCRKDCIYYDAIRRQDRILASLPPAHKSGDLNLWCVWDSGARCFDLHFSVTALLSQLHAFVSLLYQCGKLKREMPINIHELLRSRHASKFPG